MRRLLFALGFTLFCGPAFAANCTSPITGNDAGGTSRNIGTVLDASNNCLGKNTIWDYSAGANGAGVDTSHGLLVDPASAALWGVGATGSGVPANATYLGIVSGGNLVGWTGAVTVASGGIASGAIASGAVASGAIASGAVASGAIASGAVASGAYASGAISDGAEVTIGTKADAAWSSGSGTVVAIEKANAGFLSTIATNTGAAIPAGTALIGGVEMYDAGGSTKATVKAASTQSVAGDTSLIFQINPNQPQLSTALNVALAANQSVNVAQVNGVTTLTGTGAVGTGSQRVAVGTDTATIAGSAPGTAGSASANVVTVQGVASMTPVLANPGTAANWGVVATAAAPPANAVYLGANASGATGGHVAGLISCDSHVFKHITSATDTLAVQGVTSQTIRVCGWRSRAAGVATWFLENTASTNANCSSSNTQITGVATEAANTGETMLAAFWTGLANTSGNGLCINSTGTGGVDVDIWYTQF